MVLLTITIIVYKMVVLLMAYCTRTALLFFDFLWFVPVRVSLGV